MRDEPVRNKIVFLIVSAWFIPGCTGVKRWKANGFQVGPEYCSPAVPVSESWIDSGNSSIDVRPEQTPDWWRAFDDPVIDQLVHAAYQQNLNLRAAGLRVMQAREQRNIARLNLLPQSQRHFSQYARNQISRTTANAFPGLKRSFDDWQTGFDLSWELDVWGRIRRSIEASEANLDAQLASYDDILVTLVGDVVATYIEMRSFDARLELAEKNAEIQQGSLEIAEKRSNAGRVSRLDVTQATSNYADTRALIPNLRQGRRLAVNTLAILLGVTPFELEPILQEPGVLPNVPKKAVVGIPADLLRRRPDIRTAERQVAAQSAQIGISEAELYPQFGLNGEISLSAENFSDVFRGASNAGFVSPGIRWKILNYGRLKRAVRVEKLRFEEAVVNYENVVLAAHREVEDALVQFLESKTQAQELKRSAVAAAESVRLVRAQYTEGKVDFGRVFVLESALVQRQDQLVAAEANVAINLVRIYKALGGGWELRTSTPYHGTYSMDAVKSHLQLVEPEPLKMSEPLEKQESSTGQ